LTTITNVFYDNVSNSLLVINDKEAIYRIVFNRNKSGIASLRIQKERDFKGGRVLFLWVSDGDIHLVQSRGATFIRNGRRRWFIHRNLGNGRTLEFDATMTRIGKTLLFSGSGPSAKSVIFGGVQNNEMVLCEYSMAANQWETETIPMTKTAADIEIKGIMCSPDGRYVIIFGGRWLWNDILVLDRKLKRHRVLALECRLRSRQIEGAQFALLLRDRRHYQLLAAGFVREIYRTPQFKKLPALPLALKGLIAMWIGKEYIHLIGDCDRADHWKVDISDIISLI